MTYLLDTNVCMDYLRGRAVEVRKRMESILPGDVVLCSIVKNDSAAEQYGRLRASLEKQGALIGPDDLLIVSIALANNVTLVTHSTDEFKRVPGLKMEDWQA